MPVQDEATPTAVRAAAVLVALQGVALVALSSVYVVEIIVGEPNNRGSALFGALIGFMFGATLLAAARGLVRGKRRAYAPSVLIELIAVPVGIGFIQSDRPLIAAGVIAPSIVVLALLIGTPGGRSLVDGARD